MSTYLVSKDAIDLLTTASLVITGHLSKTPSVTVDPTVVTAADLAGQMLVDANTDSVNTRYNEGEKPATYTWQPISELVGSTIPATVWLQVFHAASCYESQACESPSWEASGAREFVGMIKEFITCELANHPTAGPEQNNGAAAWAGLEQCTWDWSRDAGFPQKETTA